eukprot:IDg8933t1
MPDSRTALIKPCSSVCSYSSKKRATTLPSFTSHRRSADVYPVRHLQLRYTGSRAATTTHLSVSEKRLLIDIAAFRESYVLEDLRNVAHVSTQHNIADVLTKADLPAEC